MSNLSSAAGPYLPLLPLLQPPYQLSPQWRDTDQSTERASFMSAFEALKVSVCIRGFSASFNLSTCSHTVCVGGSECSA
ncbi:hypothetical protein JOB18_041143 [Solea senegalensis]|uniref:Uncharacterized protein n=1 Tax=Solea senegalensis TaxID=28829 RepID=A0AAV6QZ77_SOLSE|nr:hypothetical protein JOB18_041143 [Solea senegalensis]